jgi:hypothetical protein
MSTSLVEECYRRAADARRLAEAASMPSTKVNLFGMEQRWLIAARSLTAKSSFGAQASEPVAQQTILNRAVAQQTIQLNDDKSQPAPPKGRPTKFTPERIQQIKNLVTEAKNREEIAGLIGVTVGSLQVTCSKLGISLRRPHLNQQKNLQEPEVPCSGTVSFTPPPEGTSVPFPFEQLDQFLQAATPQADGTGTQQASSATFTLVMRYKGHERTSELPLGVQAIGRLAIEAGFRNMSVGELVGALVKATVEKGTVAGRTLDVDTHCAVRKAD